MERDVHLMLAPKDNMQLRGLSIQSQEYSQNRCPNTAPCPSKIHIPYVIAISGAGMVCNIGSPFGFYSGILLMLLASLIWAKQLEHHKS